MNTAIRNIGTVAIIVAVIFIAYQAMVVVPNNKSEALVEVQQLKINEERRVSLDKEVRYNTCMSTAYDNYSSDWDSQCTLLEKGKDCSLAAYQYEKIEERHDRAQDRCVSLYK